MGFFVFGCLIAGYVLMLIIDYVHLLVIYKGCIEKIKNNTSENCLGDMEYYCDYRVYSGILKFIFIFITAGCTFIEPMHSGSAISVTESVLVMGTKSRCIVLPSIGLMGLAGESMVVSDPKSELYQYTYPFLEKLGYKIYTVDFRNPLKSDRYNFLQEVINAVNDGDYAKAGQKAYDITEALVPKSSGEPIWTNGEKSVLAGTIMAVVYDNRDTGKYQNLTNVYHFIANMCKMSENMPLIKYLAEKPDNHPAKALLKQSETAPSKTRGSFYISALTTLRLFADEYIYRITSDSSFSADDLGNEKTAVFMILPDEKTTYYTLASVMVDQIYSQLVELANKRGGRLKNRVNFILDEFGNFAAIPDFDTKLTVGGGEA